MISTLGSAPRASSKTSPLAVNSIHARLWGAEEAVNEKSSADEDLSECVLALALSCQGPLPQTHGKLARPSSEWSGSERVKASSDLSANIDSAHV